MNSKQLVSAALAGMPVPRVPVGPLAVHFCAGLAGRTVRAYTTDARVLAECVLRYHERFTPDAVWVSADTWVSAEAMGARVGAVGDDTPFGGLGAPLVRSAADIDRIPPPDAGAQGRYPLMLEALVRVVEAIGKDVFVVACFDQYPFSLAAALMGINEIMLKVYDDPPFVRALMGINEIMLKVYDDPPFVRALMARCAEYGAAYARALAAAGADLLSGGDSPAGLLGPELYGEMIQPVERNLIASIQAATRKPVSLHICGNATAILPAMAATGADVLELDHAVDLARACRIVGPQVALWGNLDPVGVLARGTSDLVRRKAREAVEAAQAAGHRRFVLSSGCTLAMETPAANLEALIG